MEEVVICPRCNRRSSPGTVICECGEMLGSVETVFEEEILANEKKLTNQVTTVENANISNDTDQNTKTPILSIVLYIFGVFSFIGGIILANDESLSFIEPEYWVAAGILDLVIFLFMGRILFYLDGIYRSIISSGNTGQ